MNTIGISPSGRLQLVPAADGAALADAAAAELRSALTRSSGEGLLVLSSQDLAGELPPECQFWRGLAERFFHAVCRLGETSVERWKSVPPPPTEELDELAGAAPPMRGLEYLDAELLGRLWLELRAAAVERAEQLPGGGADLLHAINPLWHLLGRVTFHLAENKQSAERPFAFLATYTHRMAGQSRLAHLPLAEALRRYSAASDRAQLDALLEPVRRAAERSELVRELLSTKALFAPQSWTIRQAHRLLTQIPLLEEAGVVVRVPDWWAARRPMRPQVQVQIGQRAASQLGLDTLLDFRVGLALEGETLTDEERRKLLASDEGLILLRGKWVEVDRQRLAQALDHWQTLASEHADGISFIEGMRLLAGAPIGDEGDAEDQAADWSHITAGDWLRKTLQRLRSPAEDARCQPGHDLRATLRPYQIEGVKWLWFLSELGLGACLADDMGLGKTIQLIDLLLQRKRAAGRAGGPANLLVVPASLLGNWRAELTRFAPTLRPIFLHRSESSAEDLERLARHPAKEIAGYDLVVTTYGLARKQEWLTSLSWGVVILDEAQAIKNASSAQARSVKKLMGHCRVVLTGTPVENHLGDLWSLFDFCSPGLLGTAGQFKRFVKRLNKQQDATAFGALRRLVRPYILRRLKTDPGVAADLPAKTVMRAECGLSKLQAALYERAVAGLAERLQTADGMARRGLVLSVLMQLKQICNHPGQYLKSDRYEPADSGKFQRLRLLCEPIAERQEKALVFTQFQSLTRPLADFLATVFGRPGLVLDGGTPVGRRTELVRSFQDPAGPPFFVISLKAGGSGLNLTAASHVIHFDRWWNPAVENQATDRAFRIGQRQNVLVHKFVCRGTVEERIDAMIESKQAVADRLLNQGGEQQLTELGDDELLRFVALDINRAAAE